MAETVTRMGVEPMISGMKAPRPRPLDERAMSHTCPEYRNYNLYYIPEPVCIIAKLRA